MRAFIVPPLARAIFILTLGLGLFAASPALANAPAKKVALPDTFVPFEAITVSILERMRVRGFLTIEFSLYVTDKELRSKIETSRRALKDAYVRVLADYGAGVARVSAPPDLSGIADRLQGVTDSVLGKKGARVLMSQAHSRMLH